MRKTPFVLCGAAIGVAMALAATHPRFLLTGADAKAPAREYIKMMELFSGAFEQVRAHYVEKPDDARLVETAINGMLAGLEDSYYLNGKDRSRRDVCSDADCQLAAGDVGVAFTMENGIAEVVTALDGTPAVKAAVMAGDIIFSIDGDPLQGLTYRQVEARLAGGVGTTVHLSLVRPGNNQPIEISLVREPAPTLSVRARSDGGDIAYLRFTQFNDRTAEQLDKAIYDITAEIGAEKLKGYVIDLRNNPGGKLEAAIAGASAFLKDVEIVSVRSRMKQKVQHYRADPTDLTHGKPAVVLINGGSASTAEVMAGALHDNHRATLIGTRTFGEGRVATLISLGPAAGTIRLITGHYVTPGGRVIEADGISPDMEVPQDVPDDLKVAARPIADKRPRLQSYVPPDPQNDKALNAALALLRTTKADAH